MLFTMFLAIVDQIDNGWALIEAHGVLIELPVECLRGNVVEGGYVIADFGCGERFEDPHTP